MENEHTKIVIIPGLGGSNANHWQSYWLKQYDNTLEIVQDNWDAPKLELWLKTLQDCLIKIDSPTVLVAHSLGVSLVLHWARQYTNPHIKGALLVAPADVDSPTHTPESIRGFSPMPITTLPFSSIVVASENDDYVSIPRAEYFSKQWGSDFINIGTKGHINSDSNLKYWEEGQRILDTLLDKTD
ncbi:RBBP9/YdeN family alpha/beta hydrolase [Psychroserpens sp. NJDZ02]|uniref:RBBP9/YdeN family alpha/beta hydrolase n=1 Tax=Psychroserpens sp. NJDZ02 TaxID=2570561 RepID=UPI0010A7A4FA|nr:alpha/beta hydrolase [Psychroserpens sp. NJDZ02]QCE43173.1 alpha/beta hydrolase [Psychroserpens sp. NJDZ02]